MRSHPGVAAKVFQTLGENGINIEMISTSPIKISCVIAADGSRRRARDPRGVRARRRRGARGGSRRRAPAHGAARGRARSGRHELRVGVLGATGAVGSTILEVLAERGFPVSEVVPFTSERSAGRRRQLRAAGRSSAGRSATRRSQGLDLVLSSAGGAVSAEWAPRLVAAGAVVVDNTSYWRMHDDVPLVVAEVNPDAVEGHSGLIANPNCSTMQAMVAPGADPPCGRHRADRLLDLPVGLRHRPAAIDELRDQAHAMLHGRSRRPRSIRTGSPSTSIPQVETFKDGDDYTTEERKMMAETRKILGAADDELRDLGDLCSGARVRRPLGVGEHPDARDRCRPRSAASCSPTRPASIVVDAPGEGLYPLASDVAGRDEVLVGRIRRDPSHERCLNMWVVGDNLRKGAATNAVQMAELLARARPRPRPGRRRRALAQALLAAIASAALIVGGSLASGQAILALCGTGSTLLAGPVGFAALLIAAGIVAGWGDAAPPSRSP